MSTPRAKLAAAVGRTWEMQLLRSQADLKQHWRRRLVTAYGVAGWREFRAVYGDELKRQRDQIAAQVRELRRRAGL